MSQTPALLVRRVRLRARRLARWSAQLWAEGGTSPDQGLSITAAEVSRLLRDPEAAAAAERRFMAEDAECVALAAPIAAADAALAADPGWARLLEAFALPPAAADTLATLLAVAWERDLRRVFAYLHDDTAQTHGTPWLAARLFGAADTAHLLRWRLADPLDGDLVHPGAAWRVDPAVALSLTTGSWQDPALRGCTDWAAEPAYPCLHPAALERLLALRDVDDIALAGPEGIGRRTLAAQFAARLGRRLLVVDSSALLAGTTPPAVQAVAVLRMARFGNAIAYWRDAELVPNTVWAQARAVGGRVLRGCRQAAAGEASVALAHLPTAQRRAAWAQHSALPPPELIATQRLTPAEIVLCARNAVPGHAGLRRTVPIQSELVTLLPCPYAWDDLVLHPDLHGQLRAFENEVRLRWTVMEEWGFGRLHPGKGVSALFGGPSGTGKTMAAQVLARTLGLDLYRIDLAGVVNKYIGETEKRLRDVFDSCERAGVLLFFDEADALFGSRTQVKDSHDRFANIEIDYLLQRVEQFDGVVILATNRKGDVDTAFLRRLRFVVEFLSPRPEERLALWRKALPACMPSGAPLLEGIDFPLLAERLQMTGADIKAAALAAAYLAHADGGRIGMRHLLAAAQREMAKHGTKLRLAWQGAGA